MAQIAEVRRDAYAQYLTAVYGFMDRARELIAKLEENAEDSARDAAHSAYIEGWDNLHPRYAPVLVAGPSQIEESAEKLRFCLGDLADKCDRWYTTRKSGDKFDDAKVVIKAQLAARGARSEFASVARDHVYG